MSSKNPENSNIFNTQGQPKNEMQFVDPAWQPQNQQQAGKISRRDFLKGAGAVAAGIIGVSAVGGGIYGLYKLTEAIANSAEEETKNDMNTLMGLFQKAHMRPTEVQVVDNKIWTPNSAHVTVTQPDQSGVGNVGITIVTESQYTPPSSYEASNFVDIANFTLSDGSFFNPAGIYNKNGHVYLLGGRVVQVSPLSKIAPRGQFSEKNANLAVLQTDMGGVVEGQFAQVQSEGFTMFLSRQPNNQNSLTGLNVQRDVAPLAVYTFKLPQPHALSSIPPQTARK